MRTLMPRRRPGTARAIVSRDALRGDTALLVYLALVSLAAHLLVANNYGYFRDELYYMADGRHLAFGYVDQPPLIGWLAALVHVTLGDSLVAIHILPAVAGACLVFVTGLMARELGGGRFAQGLAALGSLVAVIYLATASIFSMDVLDELWWALCAYTFIRIVRRNEPRLWLLFGLVAGIGLLTKATMLFFGFAMVVALVLTPGRAALRTPWLWLGGALAFLCFVPYVLWNAVNGWPTVEFWRHYGGLSGGGPISFLANQILVMNPMTLPLVIAGLYFYLRSEAGRPYRALGWAYVILYVLLTLINAKPYFLAPAYAFLYPGGALVVEQLVRRRGRAWIKPVYPTALVLSGLLFAPLAMPLLPPATFVSTYGALTGLGNSGAGQHTGGQFPQYLGDRFGWNTMTRTVAGVADALPPAERAQACVLTGNYGEASALELLGPRYHLPPVISAHNNYYLWGPGRCTGQLVIALGYDRSDLAQTFADVAQAGIVTCQYCISDENNLPVYVCRHPKVPIQVAWSRAKHFN
ncbi:MAG: glycosyltransferase family 39 protein [Ktedonobacterales bacterium]